MKIAERISLLTVLGPLKGGFELIKSKVELTNQLALSLEEQTEAGLKVENNLTSWQKDIEKDISLEKYKEVIEKALDAFKAAHEEKQDWESGLIELVEKVELLICSNQQKK